jgi:hypothetical protein
MGGRSRRLVIFIADLLVIIQASLAVLPATWILEILHSDRGEFAAIKIGSVNSIFQCPEIKVFVLFG